MTTTKELQAIRAHQVTALDGLPLSTITEPIEYSQVIQTNWQVMPEHTLTKRLLERRISLDVIAFFAIAPAPDSKGWLYPACGGLRWKNVDSHGSVKYAWKPSKPESADFYHGADLMQSIQQARGACWLVSGEPDVWALRSAGITHALSGFTESHVSKELAQYLSSLGVTVLYIAPDLDPTGKRWGSKVATALEGSGIELDCRSLPAELGEHGDLGKAWQHYTKLMDFERWLIGLPRVYPEPEPEIEPTTPREPSTDLVIPDNYRLAIIERLGVQSFNTKGWSRHNVLCPFHDDKTPSAGVHQYKGLHCLTEGTWYTWQKLGIALDLGTIADWKAREAQASSRISLSNELRAALVKAGASAAARVLDALYLLGWTPGKIFSRAEAIKALSGVVAPWSIRLALEPESTKDKETIKTKKDYCGFFPSLSLQPVTMEKSHNNSNPKVKGKPGRHSKHYKLPAPGEIADKLGIELGNHMDPIAPAKIMSQADYRAEVYAALPRAKPGNYSRKTLSERVGVSNRTAQNYDKRAALVVTERFDRQLLTVENLAELPERLEHGDQHSRWLENGEIYRQGKRAGKPRRFAPTLEGSDRALSSSPTGELWLVTQKVNHYAG